MLGTQISLIAIPIIAAVTLAASPLASDVSAIGLMLGVLCLIAWPFPHNEGVTAATTMSPVDAVT